MNLQLWLKEEEQGLEEEGIGSVIKQLCFSSARRRTERGEDANKRKSEGGVEEAESSRMG